MSPLLYFPYTGGIYHGKVINSSKMAAVERRDLPGNCSGNAAVPGKPHTVLSGVVGSSDHGIDVPGTCRDLDSCQEDTA